MRRRRPDPPPPAEESRGAPSPLQIPEVGIDEIAAYQKLRSDTPVLPERRTSVAWSTSLAPEWGACFEPLGVSFGRLSCAQQ
jgi:hypothetical protein